MNKSQQKGEQTGGGGLPTKQDGSSIEFPPPPGLSPQQQSRVPVGLVLRTLGEASLGICDMI